jgi:hypothetical protein
MPITLDQIMRMVSQPGEGVHRYSRSMGDSFRATRALDIQDRQSAALERKWESEAQQGGESLAQQKLALAQARLDASSGIAATRMASNLRKRAAEMRLETAKALGAGTIHASVAGDMKAQADALEAEAMRIEFGNGTQPQAQPGIAPMEPMAAGTPAPQPGPAPAPDGPGGARTADPFGGAKPGAAQPGIAPMEPMTQAPTAPGVGDAGRRQAKETARAIQTVNPFMTAVVAADSADPKVHEKAKGIVTEEELAAKNEDYLEQIARAYAESIPPEVRPHIGDALKIARTLMDAKLPPAKAVPLAFQALRSGVDSNAKIRGQNLSAQNARLNREAAEGRHDDSLELREGADERAARSNAFDLLDKMAKNDGAYEIKQVYSSAQASQSKLAEIRRIGQQPNGTDNAGLLLNSMMGETARVINGPGVLTKNDIDFAKGVESIRARLDSLIAEVAKGGYTEARLNAFDTLQKHTLKLTRDKLHSLADKYDSSAAQHLTTPGDKAGVGMFMSQFDDTGWKSRRPQQPRTGDAKASSPRRKPAENPKLEGF